MTTLFDYVEGLLSFLPEAVGWMTARTPDGFGLIAEKLPARALDHLEANGNHFRTSKEDNITSAALGFLNAYGIQATSQTNSKGHVDIYLKHSWQPRLAICGEAKIWRGAVHHTGGLDQVLRESPADGRCWHWFSCQAWERWRNRLLDAGRPSRYPGLGRFP